MVELLVTRRRGQLRLITQPDHAALAGRMAEAWGNEGFVTPVARDSLICAAAHHDDGWHYLDSAPAYNAAQQRPAHFTELPLTKTTGPYARGVESVYERDPRAGALVGMHFSGFYTSRWGLGSTPPSQDPVALTVVAEQEARWMPALRAAWANQGARSDFDAATWHAYEVLQVVDLLSLALGLMDLERPIATEAVDVASTLASVDQARGPRVVTAVPLSAGGDRTTISVMAVGAGSVTLDPYPFGVTELQLVVPVRQLEDRPYASAEEAAEAFHGTEPLGLGLTLTGAR